jgi:hypothetical protein
MLPLASSPFSTTSFPRLQINKEGQVRLATYYLILSSNGQWKKVTGLLPGIDQLTHFSDNEIEKVELSP